MGLTVEYRIIEERYAWDLEEQVNKLIKLGWKPQGGLVYWASGMSSFYKQAMVKE